MEANTNMSMLTGQYLDLLGQDSFEIIVKDKKYECSIYGVRSSDIIRELLDKNSKLRQYEYKFEESSDYFQLICDFFNFKKIHITTQNMISLKNIAENLKISRVITEVNNYIDSYEEIVQKINPIEELFEWLYKIDKLTVNSVKISILNSIWIHSEENIKEFAAFLLQVIRSGYILQPYLVELIVSLDKSSDETNDLNLLKPFIVKQLLLNFYKSQFYCCFICKLSKSGILSIDQIINQIISFDLFINRDTGKYKYLKSEKYDPSYHKNVVVWFYSELRGNNRISPSDLLRGLDSKTTSFLQFFDDDKIELYKEIRDSFQPTNEIAKAIFNDDVDTLQSIITKNNIKIESAKLPFHLFDLFDSNDSKSLLDYSAECGSIKCFKYLLLNHAEINQSTQGYAIYSGNTEIIRTIDQNSKEKFVGYKTKNSKKNTGNDRNHQSTSSQTKYFQFNSNDLLNPIYISIMMHQYNLFDWIIEENLNKETFDNNKLIELAKFSVISGNAHSFIQCVDKGLNLKNNKNKLNELIKISSEFGYYRLTELILCLYNDVIPELNIDESIIMFGNFAIAKLFFGIKDLKLDYEKLVTNSIQREYIDISKFIIDNFIQPTNKSSILNFFSNSISCQSSILFNYLQNKFNLIDIKNKFNITSYDIESLLTLCCTKRNYEIFCVLFQFYFQNYNVSNVDKFFYEACYSGSEEIVQYLMSNENKFSINYYKTINNYKKIFEGNWKIALLLIDKVCDEIKMPLLRLFFNESVELKNKNAFEKLLQKNFDDKNILFKALTFHDIKLINIILDHNSRPSFINQLSKDGTAICVAAKNNDLNIVKRLLSIPGINLNIRNEDGYTALIQAVYELNIEAVDIILDYYKDNVQSQLWQFEISISILLDIVKGKIKKSTKNYEEKIVIILNHLAGFNNDINLSCYDFFSPVCRNNSISVISQFLSIKDINVNFHDNVNGDTPLITAIKSKNSSLINLLIDFPKTEINLSNYNNQTPLIIAVEMNMSETVSMLINHPEFDPVESNINYAFFICSNEKSILNLLISKTSVDINYQYNQSVISLEKKIPFQVTDTVLTYAVNQEMENKVELIISHPKYDPIKSHFNEAIFNSISNIKIFKILFQINKDANIISSADGNDLINHILVSRKYNILQYIFSTPDLKIDDSIIIKYICYILKMDDKLSIDFLKYLIQYDENHNHCIHFDKLLPNGKSFFTYIESDNEKIGEIVQLLLDKGVDPNAPDSFNIYPLQYAILANSYSFFITLFNCQKIDYTVKFDKNKTYLHLAANRDYKILKELIKLNIIDINSKDDSELTPLMIAKKDKSYKNVQLIQKVIEKGSSEAISSTENEDGDNNNDDDKSPLDLLLKAVKYLHYLDHFSNRYHYGSLKLVKNFDIFVKRRYIIKEMVKIFNGINLFSTPILLDEFINDDNDYRHHDIFSDLGIDVDSIDIHNEDFFENIKIIFEYIIKIDCAISNGEIADMNERLILLEMMNQKIRNMDTLLMNFMYDDELMTKFNK